MEAPHITIPGIAKAHAVRAIRYLRIRGMLAFYRKNDKSLNVMITKFGLDQTTAIASYAMAVTKR